MINTNILFEHYLYSITATLLSLIFAIILSLLIIYISLKYKLFRSLSIKLLLIFQTIPLIIIAPFLLSIFGFGIELKILIVTLLGMYPILLSFDNAYKNINSDVFTFSKLAKFNKYENIKHIIIPLTITNLFSGIKLTTSYVFSSIILTEFIGGQYGIGIYLSRVLKNFDNNSIYIIVIITVLTTFLLLYIVSIIEKIIIKKYYGGLLV